MNFLLPLYPIWAVDFFGSLSMIVLGTICLVFSVKIYKKNRNNVLFSYLVLFFAAILLFCWSRSFGHILQHIFYFLDHKTIWKQIEPFSGSFNSMTFFIIFSITLFFYKMKKITDKMTHDREKIIKTSQEVLRLNAAIEEIITERTKTELALRVAHEIRNPITIIGGLIRRLIKESFIENSLNGAREKLEKVIEKVALLEKLVIKFEGIREKDKAIYFAPCEMNQIVEDIVDVVRLEASEKGILLYLDIAPSSLDFYCNKHLIKVIILHVVRNALDFCPRGSIIEIETKKIAKGILVRITDNGPGIPEHILAHIFEPFAMTEFGETGLELPYIKQIVEEHRGEISIKSEVGKGASVEMIFPTHLDELKNIAGNRNNK